MTDPTPIDNMERIVKLAVVSLKGQVEQTSSFLGDRPFLRTKQTLADQYAAYREMRGNPYSMYMLMESVFNEMEGRLSLLSEQERLDKNVDSQFIREIATLEVLRYCDRMRRYELKQQQADMVRSEEYPPPILD